MLQAVDGFFGKRGLRYDQSTAATRFEQLLGAGALVLLGCVVAAVARGQSQWHLVPPIVWAHLATILLALAITPVMLWRRRGDHLHRRLGWIWAIAMFATAVMSFGIRLTNRGDLSVIHILSVITIIGVPVLVIAARRHDLARHRGQARGFVIGALLVAGFFTFPFNRLLGSWLFG